MNANITILGKYNFIDIEAGFEHPSYSVLEGEKLKICLTSNIVGQHDISEFSVLISTMNTTAHGNKVSINNDHTNVLTTYAFTLQDW